MSLLQDVLEVVGAATLVCTLVVFVLIVGSELLHRTSGPARWEEEDPPGPARPELDPDAVARRCGWCHAWLDEQSQALHEAGAPISDGVCNRCRRRLDAQIHELTQC